MGRVLLAKTAIFTQSKFFFYLLLVALGVMRDTAAEAAFELHQSIFDLSHSFRTYDLRLTTNNLTHSERNVKSCRIMSFIVVFFVNYSLSLYMTSLEPTLSKIREWGKPRPQEGSGEEYEQDSDFVFCLLVLQKSCL